MPNRTLIYWHGIVGIAGKGPNWMEQYDPNRTIGDIIHTMTSHKLNDNGKRIEILKHQPGNIGKVDNNNPYWSHRTKLSEYVQLMSDYPDIMLIYCIV